MFETLIKFYFFLQKFQNLLPADPAVFINGNCCIQVLNPIADTNFRFGIGGCTHQEHHPAHLAGKIKS